MGRHAKDSGGDFTPAPAGTHRAVCVGLVDIGTQRGEFQGQVTVRNQVIIRWELSDEPMEDGQPYIVSGFFTNSLNEKSRLRPLLEAWRGRAFTEEELGGFDLQSILGAPCLVTVIHKDGRARVQSVSSLPKGMPKPQPKNPLKAFWIEEWSQAAFEALPAGFQKLIQQSDEYKEMVGSVKHESVPSDDDIPF